MNTLYTILSIDTSTYNLSICLYKNGFFYTKETKSLDHSESIFDLLTEILKETKTSLNQFTHLAVNVGPGSFTGLRVGLSFIKTLSIYLNIKIITTTSFNLLVRNFLINKKSKEKKILTLYPSVKNEFYFCEFEINFKNIVPKKFGYIKVKDLSNSNYKLIIAPEEIEFNSSKLKIKKVKVSAKNIIEIFLEKGFKNLSNLTQPSNLFPLYIRHTYY